MTPEQRTELLSLVRAYGDAEVGWTRHHINYIWSDDPNAKEPSTKPVVAAYQKVLDFVHKL